MVTSDWTGLLWEGQTFLLSAVHSPSCRESLVSRDDLLEVNLMFPYLERRSHCMMKLKHMEE